MRVWTPASASAVAPDCVLLAARTWSQAADWAPIRVTIAVAGTGSIALPSQLVVTRWARSRSTVAGSSLAGSSGPSLPSSHSSAARAEF